ncbi:MAG: ABC transporter substrate-binding protein [Psychroflexus halocasei]|uniref:ABC transporter substrate-binding protein n=1 Tax=Psychroflexus sp. S27 TaxID=1982757 RepID=UPI00267AD7C8|nr:ABC transporter substrate-binding protein [Psychroflexus sp. S27]
MKERLLHFFIIIFIATALFSCTSNQKEERDHMVFRYNEHANITSLDPAFAKDQRNIWACEQLYNTLVRLDNELNIQPDIAKSWTISEDAKTYRFNLRDDVFFHQNKIFGRDSTRQLVAKDVVYSLNRLTDPKVSSPGSWILEKVKHIKAIDESTIVIELKEAFPAFLGTLSMKYCSILPQEADGINLRKNPIGTGPFKFKRWIENEKLVFRKNELYFETDKNGEQLPYLEAVAITFLPDKQSEFMAFVQGKIDFLSGLDPSYKDELLTNTGQLQKQYQDDIVLDKSPYLNTEYLGFNMESESPEIQSIDFRRAVNYAFDRTKMIKYLRNGIGRPAHHGFIPEGLPGFEQIEAFTYQPQKAKKLLEKFKNESGIKRPQLQITTNANYLDLVEYIQKSLEDIGIQVAIEVLPPSTIRQQRSAGQLDLFRASWIADYPDAENYLGLFYSPQKAPKGPNYTFFENAEFDSIFEKSQTTTTDSLRYQMYTKLDQLIIEESPIIPLYYDEVTRFYQKNIEGLKMNPINLLVLKTVKKTK